MPADTYRTYRCGIHAGPWEGSKKPACPVCAAPPRFVAIASLLGEQAVERAADTLAAEFGYSLDDTTEVYNRDYWMRSARAILEAAVALQPAPAWGEENPS